MVAFLTLLLAVAEPLPPPQPAKPELFLPGTYAVAGTLSGGDDYTGACLISRRGEGLLFKWVTDTGNAVGIGQRLPDGSVVVGGTMGLCRYRVEADAAGKPKLTGTWLDGNGMLHVEILTWLK